MDVLTLSRNARVVIRDACDPKYQHAVHQFASDSFNEHWTSENLSPDAIVYCACEADVVTTVRAASSASPPVHLRSRSGGHSSNGYSSRTRTAGGWVVDVSMLQQVVSDSPDVMRVGAGLKLHQLNAELWKRKRSFPKGICRGVAIGGHLQSSAFGPLRSTHGSGLDHVLAFRMVLADGTLIVAKRDNAHRELFFCVLGGFPGSYGIVTEYTIRTIPDNECPNFTSFNRRWSLPALGVHHVHQIIERAQRILQQQEQAGTRDCSVSVMIGMTHISALDALPDLPVVGQISNYITVRPDPDISAAVVDVLIRWNGIDSGKFTDRHYQDIVAPFDGITTGLQYPSLMEKAMDAAMRIFIGSTMSSVTNTAFSYNHPVGHRYLVVGNHSNSWFDSTAIHTMSSEITRRVRARQAFSLQLLNMDQSSQWSLNKHLNILGWRDSRVVCDDWVYFRPLDTDPNTIIDALESFHQSLPWSTVPGTTMRLETFMGPDSDKRPAPHERTFEELRAFFPNPGDLERLIRLKRQVDLMSIFNGMGTISSASLSETRPG